jgi:hypothetical protein
MASNITTTNIDITFPVPGQDNDTQGFRDNFIAIVNALTTASMEISDMQAIQTGIVNSITTLSAPTQISATIVTSTVIDSVTINTRDVLSTGTITANKFVGDGSYLTNIQSPSITALGTLKYLNIGSADSNDSTVATLTAGHKRLSLTGVSGINIVSTLTTTATLFGGLTVGLLQNVLLLDSVSNINVGYTFKLYTTETAVHTVIGINTASNLIATDPFDPTLAIAAGVTSGTVLTFNLGQQVGSATYAGSAPTSSVGNPGDTKGTIFATSNTVYVCYADYVNSSTNIWTKVTGSTF